MTAGSEAPGWPAGRLDRAGYEELCRALAGPVPAGYRIHTAACDRWAGDRDRRALLDLTGPDPRWWTFAALRETSLRLANGLRAAGVRAGNRVAVLLPQGAEAALSHLAIYRLGAVAVPLSVMYGPEAVGHRLRDAGCVAAIAGVETWQRVAEGQPLAGACRWVLTGTGTGIGSGTGTGAAPAGTLSFHELITGGADRLDPEPRVAATTAAMIVYTSGTTGPAKGVVHGHRVVAAHAAPIRFAHDDFPRPGDLMWSPADWAWAGGLVDCLLSAWHAGVPVVAYRDRRFDPERVMDLMARWEVRNTFLPPTALRMLREAGAAAPRPALRSVMTGGEPVGADIAQWTAERLGVVPNEVYGQTEASCVLGNSRTVLAPRPGSPGLAYPGAVVEILPATGDGTPVPAGTVGEIAVRADSPALFLGYWGRPEATAGKVRDGWLRTGDLGYRDPEGYFWFVSRRDDVILSAGYRIGPGEVEACLERHPAVAAAAVVGVPDARRGQLVKAVVVARTPPPDRDRLAEALRAHVRTRLAPYQVPRLVEFVDELPLTVTGKVMRGRLRTGSTPDAAPADQAGVG